jgi:hypothetical protein
MDDGLLADFESHEFTVTLADDPVGPVPPSPEELALDEDARTGRPRTVSVIIEQLEWYGEARVLKLGPGNYTFEALSKMRRRLTRPPNPNPNRLP